VVRTGPFAWNGAISFWLKIGAFATFLVVMFIALRTAINRQAHEEQGAS
jgi:membrane protein implicated in regulation of membrane protease activity